MQTARSGPFFAARAPPRQEAVRTPHAARLSSSGEGALPCAIPTAIFPTPSMPAGKSTRRPTTADPINFRSETCKNQPVGSVAMQSNGTPEPARRPHNDHKDSRHADAQNHPDPERRKGQVDVLRPGIHQPPGQAARPSGGGKPRCGDLHLVPQHQLLQRLPVLLVRPPLRPGGDPGRRGQHQRQHRRRPAMAPHPGYRQHRLHRLAAR
ncbi:hypothetical protein D9M71_617970 [compost metagenome]